MADELKSCPLCGGTVEFHYNRGSGIGGQAFTVTVIAECEDCLTVFRSSAPSTAGFTRRQALEEWNTFIDTLPAMRDAMAKRIATK